MKDQIKVEGRITQENLTAAFQAAEESDEVTVSEALATFLGSFLQGELEGHEDRLKGKDLDLCLTIKLLDSEADRVARALDRLSLDVARK